MPMAHACFSCSMMNDFISFPTMIWYIALFTNHSVTSLLVNQQRSHDRASFSKRRSLVFDYFLTSTCLPSDKHSVMRPSWGLIHVAGLPVYTRPGLSRKIGIHEPGQGGRPGLKAGLNRQNLDFTGLKRVVSDYIESYNTYNNMRFHKK